jgi:hypothetical protein
MVMGAFAHSRLAELFHRSGTRDILERSPMPLCLQPLGGGNRIMATQSRTART